MKRLLLLFSAVIFTLGAQAQTHQGVGVVKSVDQAKGSVMIKHEAIASLNWPGMTMGFDIRDKQLLARLKPEQKISFEIVAEKGRYVIIAVK